MNPDEATADGYPYLRRAGAAVLLEAGSTGLPRVLHWGADLGALSTGERAALAEGLVPPVPRNALDEPWPLTLLPTQGEGWLGRPGLAAHRDGAVVYPRWQLVGLEVGQHRVTATSQDAGLAVSNTVQLAPGGLLGVQHTVHNTAEEPLVVDRLEAYLPLVDAASEPLDLTGRWAKERVPQRGALQYGARVRESRRGRTGHDAATTLYAGTHGFSFRSGELWGVHVATSGNHVYAVERLPEGAGGAVGILGGGELLEPGEIRLAAGECYTTPWVWFTHSGAGLDGAAHRFHDYLRLPRARPGGPAGGRQLAGDAPRPRPLVFNTWEAVYLCHDQERLFSLADRAAHVGVELFVLDDGWFHGRPGTTRRGLGDWWVDAQAWPQGLGPLAERVHSLGMELGLWVEPEMVNPDSELARCHPEWVLATDRWPRLSRHQLALDVARPEVADYLRAALGDLITRYGITFLKWDHNRDLHEAVHHEAAGVHRQTRAVYQLMADLRAAHPRLEIESCASGGARVDLGVLEYTDRVWVSDTNDPLERQRIQQWTSQLVPLELQGSHIGPPRAHTTGRISDITYRGLTALFGHAGIEWDITECTDEELALLRRWSALYREMRPVLHSGRLVRADHPDPAAELTGVLSSDSTAALYLYTRLDTSVTATGERLRFPGLIDAHTYRVEVRRDLGEPRTTHVTAPRWTFGPVTLPGTVLRTVGLAAPQLEPQSAMLISMWVARPQ